MMSRHLALTAAGETLRFYACVGAGLVATGVYLWRKSRVPRGTITFGPRQMVSTVAAPGEAARRVVVRYREFRHLELVDRGLIRARFRAPAPGAGDSLDFPVPRRTTEDVFDYLVELVRDDDPGNLFSAFQDGHIEFSRSWTVEEVFPWSRPVRTVALGFPGTWADAARFKANWYLGRLRIEPEDGGGPAIVADRERILVDDGLVAGTVEFADGGLVLHFGSGDHVELSAGGVVAWGEVVGRLDHAKDRDPVLRMSGPMPSGLALGTLAAYRYGRDAKWV